MGGGSQHPREHLRPQDHQLPRWLSVHQIRQFSRCRREMVINAMDSGELRFEQRGRNRYVLRAEYLAWEQRRQRPDYDPNPTRIRQDLADLL